MDAYADQRGVRSRCRSARGDAGGARDFLFDIAFFFWGGGVFFGGGYMGGGLKIFYNVVGMCIQNVFIFLGFFLCFGFGVGGLF